METQIQQETKSILIPICIILIMIMTVVSIVWITLIIKLESYCTKNHRIATFIFIGRTLISILIFMEFLNTKFKENLILYRKIINLILVCLDSSLLILMAKGWLSLIFISIYKFFKVNFLIYIYIFLMVNSLICCQFFSSYSKFETYDCLQMVFVIYVSIVSYNSFKQVNLMKNNLTNISLDYQKCLNIKKFRFHLIFCVSLFKLFLYFLMILLSYRLDLSMFKHYFRIFIDNVCFMLILVFYKPSSIKLINHLNPSENIIKQVIF